ncbi:hypothetical protein H0H92_002047 [Tricholoma furcatifolium]|nr:hypothetical protein H0H92_002047 [Tricholoma furcatifolium]
MSYQHHRYPTPRCAYYPVSANFRNRHSYAAPVISAAPAVLPELPPPTSASQIQNPLPNSHPVIPDVPLTREEYEELQRDFAQPHSNSGIPINVLQTAPARKHRSASPSIPLVTPSEGATSKHIYTPPFAQSVPFSPIPSSYFHYQPGRGWTESMDQPCIYDHPSVEFQRDFDDAWARSAAKPPVSWRPPTPLPPDRPDNQDDGLAERHWPPPLGLDHLDSDILSSWN